MSPVDRKGQVWEDRAWRALFLVLETEELNEDPNWTGYAKRRHRVLWLTDGGRSGLNGPHAGHEANVLERFTWDAVTREDRLRFDETGLNQYKRVA